MLGHCGYKSDRVYLRLFGWRGGFRKPDCTNAAVSFAKPDWPTGSDQDSQQGIETRVALLDRLATDKLAIVGYHLPDGGMGRVERDGTTYRFASDG